MNYDPVGTALTGFFKPTGEKVMAQETGAEQEKVDQLSQAMNESGPHRVALSNCISPLMREIFAEALRCLEEAMPNSRDPEHPDHRLFKILRSRVLDVGNAKIRELPSVLQDFIVLQVYERQVVRRQMPTQGAWRLPVGVKMPNERNTNRG